METGASGRTASSSEAVLPQLQVTQGACWMEEFMKESADLGLELKSWKRPTPRNTGLLFFFLFGRHSKAEVEQSLWKDFRAFFPKCRQEQHTSAPWAARRGHYCTY